MKMVNDKGDAVYFNCVFKRDKIVWVIKGIGSTEIKGRDKQRLKSRTFTQQRQAESYLDRLGYRMA